MKTESILVQTLCAPCACRCRYCLLSWDGRTIGAELEECEGYAKGFFEWIGRSRPELSFHFAFGFSMDHPRLLQAIDFQNSIGSVGGRFLQFDGMAFRSDPELARLLGDLRAHGVEALNFTFYGTEGYHDRFAGRRGDHAFMLKTMRTAKSLGLSVSAGVPLTEENAGQADALVRTLEEHGAESVRLFVPHGEGRGVCLDPVRLSLSDLGLLGAEARGRLNREVYRTEAEWCGERALAPEEKRMLIVSLTEENIGRFRAMGFEEAIRLVEGLDEAYYAAFPDREELVRMYGDRQGERLYSQRDLFHHYRTRYAEERGLDVYDVTDERQCGSRRY